VSRARSRARIMVHSNNQGQGTISRVLR
jgi:hypothetical protein